MSTEEVLLKASIERVELMRRIRELEAENAKLRRYQGMARLMEDMRRDLDAEAEPVSMFHRRQAE